MPSVNPSWKDEARCEALKDTNPSLWDAFYSDDLEERQYAATVCGKCPVKRECLQAALRAGEIWGVWGGCDETELRRTLSVDTNGIERKKARSPRCPSCKAGVDNLNVETPDTVRCALCKFRWTAATSARAVLAIQYPDRPKSAAPQEKTAAAKRVSVRVARTRLPQSSPKTPRRQLPAPTPTGATQADYGLVASARLRKPDPE